MDLGDTKKVVELDEIMEGTSRTFAFSPKGDELAEIHEDKITRKLTLKIYDFKTKIHKTIYETRADFYISSWSSDGKFVYVVEELNNVIIDSQVLIKKVDIESDDHPVTILQNENGKNIGSD